MWTQVSGFISNNDKHYGKCIFSVCKQVNQPQIFVFDMVKILKQSWLRIWRATNWYGQKTSSEYCKKCTAYKVFNLIGATTYQELSDAGIYDKAFGNQDLDLRSEWNLTHKIWTNKSLLKIAFTKVNGRMCHNTQYINLVSVGAV